MRLGGLIGLAFGWLGITAALALDYRDGLATGRTTITSIIGITAITATAALLVAAT